MLMTPTKETFFLTAKLFYKDKVIDIIKFGKHITGHIRTYSVWFSV